MSVISSARASLVALLSGITGIGRVHDYTRRVEHDADRKTLLVTTGGRLHCWFVSLADEDPYEEAYLPARCTRARVVFSLHGYYALADADASEKAFCDVVDDVLDAIRGARTLSGTVIEAGPPRWREAGHREFAGALCHYARIDVALVAEVG